MACRALPAVKILSDTLYFLKVLKTFSKKVFKIFYFFLLLIINLLECLF